MLALCALFALSDAQAPPTLARTFCTDKLDQTSVDGKVSPALTFKYRLCVDTDRKSWRRSDSGVGDLIFNGTHLITISVRRGYTCSVSPPYQGDPLKAMPFTALVIDAGATPNGTTTLDGVDADVWVAHRDAVPAARQPDEFMYWYVSAARALVRATADVKPQGDYPQGALLTYDYFASGNFTTDVPPGTFKPPPETKCS